MIKLSSRLLVLLLTCVFLASCSSKETTESTSVSMPENSTDTAATASFPREPTLAVPDAQVPEAVANSTVCIMSNVSAFPIVVQAELAPPLNTVEDLAYLDRTNIDVPDTDNPIIFSVWSKRNKDIRTRCPLKRGNCYQVFVNAQTKKLSVAMVRADK
jgi:hypothetical protein